MVVVFVAACQPEPDATIVVDNFNDATDIDPGNGSCAAADGSCTLRAAVMEANASAGTDQIVLPPGTYTLDLVGAGDDTGATGDLDLIGSTYIEAASGTATIDATGLGDRILDIRGGIWHHLDGLRLINGSVTGDGGAIRAGAGIVIANVEITGNSATGAGGGMANSGALVFLEQSSVWNNTAATGGGAHTTSAFLAENTTFSANTGGAVHAASGYSRLWFSTVTDNNDGGVNGPGATHLMASVIADQASGADCSGPTTSADHNVDSDNTCGLSQPNDSAGAAVDLGALSSPGPALFPGHPPIGSPLVDSVPVGVLACGGPVVADQHERVRPAGSACDVGALESVQLVQTDFCSFDDIVHDAVFANGGYYVGGAFTQVADGSGTNVARPGLARCTPQGQVDTGFDVGLSTEVNALTAAGPWLYVGGSFDVTVSGTRYRGIARIDLATGSLDTSWNPNVNGSVRDIAVDAGGVFVGGNMTHVNGDPIARITKLDAATGARVPSFGVTVNHTNSWENVLTLHVHSSGDLFLGGTFDSVNGAARASAARVHPTTGALAAFDPDLTDTNPNDPKVQVEAIVEHQGQIYLCGDWWETEGVGSQTDQRNVGRFDPVSGSADMGWLPSISRGLQACAIDATGMNLVVTGDHTKVNGQTVGAVQGLALTTGTVDPSWLPDPATTVGVKAIVVTPDAIVLGGDITAASGTAVGNATRYALG
ncbi:MAG: hypothetical protein ACR2QE_14915 [Acidimicrobiales bacterium]